MSNSSPLTPAELAAWALTGNPYRPVPPPLEGLAERVRQAIEIALAAKEREKR